MGDRETITLPSVVKIALLTPHAVAKRLQMDIVKSVTFLGDARRRSTLRMEVPPWRP